MSASRQAIDPPSPNQSFWIFSGPAPPRDAASGARPTPRASGLTRDRIVTAAIAVADAEGPEAVSMRRIARDLHVSPMALYWHVSNKDDLLRLMVDAVEGEIEIPHPSGDWRADLTNTARRYRQTLLRHGWMTSFIGHRRSLGPNELPHIENSLAALDDLGLTIQQAFNVLMAVETYYLGFAIREQQELAMEQANKQMTPAQIRKVILSESARLRAENRYPHVAELFERGTFLTRDQRFDFGLARLLDGIQADLHPGTKTQVDG